MYNFLEQSVNSYLLNAKTFGLWLVMHFYCILLFINSATMKRKNFNRVLVLEQHTPDFRFFGGKLVCLIRDCTEDP